MPATVATSLRLNRSDAMVITVIDKVWCANPARQINATAATGLSTNPVNITPIIMIAPSVKVPRRASISPQPRC